MGCTEASFTIFEMISHTLERGSKVLAAFLMSAKLSIQFGLTSYYTNHFRSLIQEVERAWLLKTCTLKSEVKYYILAHCPEI